MNPVRSNKLSFKYQSYAQSYCKDVRIRKFEFVVETQFLVPFYMPFTDYIFYRDIPFKFYPKQAVNDQGQSLGKINYKLFES